jgi:hypothetical protein
MADPVTPPATPPAGQPDLTQQLADLTARVTASEKKASEAAAAQAQLTAQLQREAVKAAAIGAGVIDPALLDHLPMQGTEVKDGKVHGVDVALKKLKEDFPKIFGAAPQAVTPPTTTGTPPAAVTPPAPVPVVTTPVAGVPQPPGATQPKPRDIRNMSREEYQKALEEQRRKVASGEVKFP